MGLLNLIFRRKKPPIPFDPDPGETTLMPARPYRVLAADLPFYSDSTCQHQVEEARLVLLQCEDPAQKHKTLECMPVLKNYRAGQLVTWEVNNKKQWQESWYRNPATDEVERAWLQAVEFIGKVIKVEEIGDGNRSLSPISISE